MSARTYFVAQAEQRLAEARRAESAAWRAYRAQFGKLEYRLVVLLRAAWASADVELAAAIAACAEARR